MNAKFTPGPWRLIPRDAANRPPAVQRGAQGGFVVNGLDAATEDADARLIASAPMLLEALKSIVDDYEFCKAHPAWGDRGESYAESARLAIAAATGENA